jgi:hypothetical protein
MRRVASEPILNKISASVADPHFRHIVGQQKSTFSWRKVLESGAWVIVNLQKGRLGEEAMTLGSLFLSMIKNALFSRRSAELFTFYCDEVQNLVSYDSGLDTMLSESRKFGISVVSANQFLDQYPPAMRSAGCAILAYVRLQRSRRRQGARRQARRFEEAKLARSGPQRNRLRSAEKGKYREDACMGMTGAIKRDLL